MEAKHSSDWRKITPAQVFLLTGSLLNLFQSAGFNFTEGIIGVYLEKKKPYRTQKNPAYV